MHETSLSQSILRAVLAELQRIEPPLRLKRVRVVAGSLHPIVPDDIVSAYVREARGTPAEGSVLELSIAPRMGRCTACGWRGEIGSFACGSCGSLDLELEAGDGFTLEVGHQFTSFGPDGTGLHHSAVALLGFNPAGVGVGLARNASGFDLLRLLVPFLW